MRKRHLTLIFILIVIAIIVKIVFGPDNAAGDTAASIAVSETTTCTDTETTTSTTTTSLFTTTTTTVTTTTSTTTTTETTTSTTTTTTTTTSATTFMTTTTTSETTTFTTTETTVTTTATTYISPVNTDLIGGDGVVHVNGYSFNLNFEAQYLYDMCEQYELRPEMMYAVMMVESAVGSYGVTNLCGITSIAAKAFNNDTGKGYYNWNTDPYQNIEISCWCLRGSYDHYGNGSDYDALAGYNRGYYGNKAGSYSSYAEKTLRYMDTVY